MKHVDEFRDPEATKTLLNRSERTQPSLARFRLWRSAVATRSFLDAVKVAKNNLTKIDGFIGPDHVATIIGTCMVSPEGACAAYYNFGRINRDEAATLR